jgi:hypothetical protein
MTASIVDEEIPREIEDSIVGLGLLAGGANVVMQLSRLPVGHGVARSTVDSGRVDKHPVKRLRTTAAYLVIALFGTAQERLAMRHKLWQWLILFDSMAVIGARRGKYKDRHTKQDSGVTA